VQAETTRTRIRRSCGVSWDRSVIAAVPPSQQLLGPSSMDGRHPDDPAKAFRLPQFWPRRSGLRHWCCAVRWPVLHLRVAYFGQYPKRLGSRQNIFACPSS
jgi:hypothetical protein